MGSRSQEQGQGYEVNDEGSPGASTNDAEAAAFRLSDPAEVAADGGEEGKSDHSSQRGSERIDAGQKP